MLPQVLARSEAGTTDGLPGLSLFLCEAGPAITVRRLEDKTGIHSSPTCELVFHDTPAFLIGDRQRGLMTYVLSLFKRRTACNSGPVVGIAQAAFTRPCRLRRNSPAPSSCCPPLPPCWLTCGWKSKPPAPLPAKQPRMDLSIATEKRFAGSQGLASDEKKQLKKDAKRYERSLMLYCKILLLRDERQREPRRIRCLAAAVTCATTRLKKSARCPITAVL